MTFSNVHIIFGATVIFILIGSCVEPFEAQTFNFENVLVVDARLTDEEKIQHVKLARSYKFVEDTFLPESNATVIIIDDSGNTYAFEDSGLGVYASSSAFAAISNVGYELLITTSDGKLYRSNTVVAPKSTPIDEVIAEIDMNEFGEQGLQISLTNENANADTKYFRYEYEETYKIIAPYWNPFEFDVVDSLFFEPNDNDGLEVNIKPRIEESRICYNTNISQDISLSDSERNVNNQTGKIAIRFLKNNDFIISHRYSILVKQFGLTSEAHAYYNDLDDFTSSESVFNEVQPGFLEGNINSVDNNELVLGYFEVASLNAKRLFFNYVDFFPDQSLPEYIINCNPTASPQLISFVPHVGPGFIVDEVGFNSPLLNGIRSGLIAYFYTNDDYEEPVGDGIVDGLGPYFVKSTGCIDCRVLGSNEKPDFWIE